MHPHIKIVSSLITISAPGSEIVADDMAGCMRRRTWSIIIIKASISHKLDVSTGMKERWALGTMEIAHPRAELDRSGTSVIRYR